MLSFLAFFSLVCLKRMFCQGEFCQRVAIAFCPYGFFAADVVHGFYGFFCFPNAEAVAIEDVFIAAGVQFGKAAPEFKFIAIHGDGAECTHAFLFDSFRYGILVDAKKPAYAAFFELQKAGSSVVLVQVYHIFFDIAKYPGKHVKKMYANVGSHTT